MFFNQEAVRPELAPQPIGKASFLRVVRTDPPDISFTWKPLDSVKIENQTWACFFRYGKMNQTQARGAIEATLTPGFLQETLSMMGYGEGIDLSEVQLQLMQMGQKCNVFKASVCTGPKPEFVLMQSKGGEGLNIQLEQDYNNLSETRMALREAGLPVFIPQPYVLGGNFDAIVFSYEFLPDHDEVNHGKLSVMLAAQTPYLEAVANSYSPKGGQFNRAIWDSLKGLHGFVYPECYIREDLLRSSYYYRTSEALKAEMVTRLYLIYSLMGRLPKEFSVGAGDFMANFDWRVDDFDLRLITIRGGWESVAATEFYAWVMDRKEIVGSSTGERIEPSFFNDPQTVLRGIKKAERLLAKAA